jgi:hypothetical protein
VPIGHCPLEDVADLVAQHGRADGRQHGDLAGCDVGGFGEDQGVGLLIPVSRSSSTTVEFMVMTLLDTVWGATISARASSACKLAKSSRPRKIGARGIVQQLLQAVRSKSVI